MATAISTTPLERPPSSSRQRSNSQSRNNIPSRPTTPLRPPSRTSLRASQTTPSGGLNASLSSSAEAPLAALEPGFAELSDSMADLEANFMHLQLLNESLGRFNECFGAFLYGMNMGAFCVDFPEAPIPQSFARHKDTPSNLQDSPFRPQSHPADVEATFLTTDTSFVENPPTSSKPASKYSSAPASARGSRQTMVPSRGTAGGRGASGVARATGTRGGASAGSARAGGGVGRGSSTRGRGVVR